MYLPMPVLAALGIVLLVLALVAFRRRGGGRDLIAPPRAGSTARRPEPLLPRNEGEAPAGDLPAELAGELRQLLAAGQKLEAIKQLRAATGLGLAEAKDMVERM